MAQTIDVAKLRLMLDADAKGLKNVLTSAGKDVKTFANDGTSALTKLSNIAKVGLGVVVLAAVATGGALLKLGEKFQKMEFTIRKETGATGKALQDLTKSAKTVYAQTAASAQDVATAIAVIAKRADQTGKTLERLALDELRLSRITGGDLRGQIEQTTRFFGDWSIATDKQTEALDWMLKVSQETGISIEQLARQTVFYGAPLRQLGFDYQTATAMMGKFEKEGVNIMTVLSGLRMGLMKFAKSGEDPVQALKEVIEKVKEAGSQAEANSIAFQVFGSRAGPDMAAAIREGRFELDELIQKLKDSPETLKEAASATETIGSKFEKMKHKLELAFAPQAEVLLKGLEDAIDEISKAVETGDWQKIGESIGNAIAEGLKAAKPAIVQTWKLVFNAALEAAGLKPGEGPTKEQFDLSFSATILEGIRQKGEEAGKSMKQAFIEGIGQVRVMDTDNPGEFRPLNEEEFTRIAEMLGIDFTPAELQDIVEYGLPADVVAGMLAKQAEKIRKKAEEQAAALRAAQAATQPPYNPPTSLPGPTPLGPQNQFTPGGSPSGPSFVDNAIAGQQAAHEAELATQAAKAKAELDKLNAAEQAHKQALEDMKDEMATYKGALEQTIRPQDAWSNAVDKSVQAIEDQADAMDKKGHHKTAKRLREQAAAFDAAKTSMKDYLTELKNQLQAAMDEQKNLQDLSSLIGKLYADPVKQKAMIDLLNEQAAQNGPEYVKMLVGASETDVKAAFDTLYSMAQQTSDEHLLAQTEAQQQTAADNAALVAEAYAGGMNTALETAIVTSPTPIPSTAAGATTPTWTGAGEADAGNWATGFETKASKSMAEAAGITSSLASLITSYDWTVPGRTAGAGIGAGMRTSIQAALSERSFSATVNLTFTFDGKAAGDLGMGLDEYLSKKVALSPVPGKPMAGMTAHTTSIWNAVKRFDPGARFAGGRANRPYTSDHPSGRAFDFAGSASEMNRDAWMLAQSGRSLGIKYIIHNPLGIWTPSRGWSPYVPAASVRGYAGASAWHYDHVHVSSKYDMGGRLPRQAKFQQPMPNLIQWAEPETGGEYFIPVAPAKRERSRELWVQAGQDLGMFPSFARGGYSSMYQGIGGRQYWAVPYRRGSNGRWFYKYPDYRPRSGYGIGAGVSGQGRQGGFFRNLWNFLTHGHAADGGYFDGASVGGFIPDMDLAPSFPTFEVFGTNMSGSPMSTVNDRIQTLSAALASTNSGPRVQHIHVHNYEELAAADAWNKGSGGFS